MARRTLKQFWRDGIETLKQFGKQGAVETQNAVYPGSNIAVPSVVSQAQLQSHYQQSLDRARDRPETEREQGREM